MFYVTAFAQQKRTSRGSAKVIPNAFAPLTGQTFADTSDRCIEDQAVINKILRQLETKGRLSSTIDTLPEKTASTPVNSF
jgi:hypothetical protein